MKVTIDNVVQIADEVLVTFSTDFGNAAAVWSGVPPTIGACHDVELEIEESVVWGESAIPAPKEDCSIGVMDGSINLTGKIISVDAEGVVVFDVGGSITLIEIVGFTGAAPIFVDLKVGRLVLFPTGV
ncbi:hypothetical protein [Pseudomonas sp. GM48]|uniref:hypothetical protein n=1 Tax=Pseudomonas sp. GM48 TaxID=1144330 RepID=UPI000518CB9F|nr:hypothetical protein [Pseudomonas sp. GM48]